MHRIIYPHSLDAEMVYVTGSSFLEIIVIMYGDFVPHSRSRDIRGLQNDNKKHTLR